MCITILRTTILTFLLLKSHSRKLLPSAFPARWKTHISGLEFRNHGFYIFDSLFTDNVLFLAMRTVTHFFENVGIMENHVGNGIIAVLPEFAWIVLQKQNRMHIRIMFIQKLQWEIQTYLPFQIWDHCELPLVWSAAPECSCLSRLESAPKKHFSALR